MNTNIRKFETGAVRNVDAGKARMSLIPHAELMRVLERFRDGAERFGSNNWKLGMPTTELYDSAQRHLTSWFQKDASEDHMAAAVWNILCAMWMETNKPELDNR